MALTNVAPHVLSVNYVLDAICDAAFAAVKLT